MVTTVPLGFPTHRILPAHGIWLPTYGGIELEFDEIDIEDSPDCVKD